jgi:hypothetical protein
LAFLLADDEEDDEEDDEAVSFSFGPSSNRTMRSTHLPMYSFSTSLVNGTKWPPANFDDCIRIIRIGSLIPASNTDFFIHMT